MPRTLIAVLFLNLWMQASFVPEKPAIQDEPLSARPDTASHNETGAHAKLGEIYGKLPLSFERNQGQVDGKVKFLSRGSGYTMFLTATEAVLSLRVQSPKSKDRRSAPTLLGQSPCDKSAVLRMKLVGGNPAPEVTGLEELRGKSNYFIGSDAGKWRTNVATYAKVKYREVYPGIDLVYYGNQRKLEYDWIVSPGADPSVIKFAVEGARSTKVVSNGDLVLATGGRDVRLHKPVIYQETDGVRREIAGAFAPGSNQEIGFTIADYDRAKPLVIDPVLSYSTYLGGNGPDYGNAIAVDGFRNVIVTGATRSSNFPMLHPLDSSANGSNYEVFVTKFDVVGTLLYSTYLGGGGHDWGNGIAVDGLDNAYVTGYTDSTNFPTRNARQPAKRGGYDAFVAKISSLGSYLEFSTYHGGSGNDFGNGIAVDLSGRAYITGNTNSLDLGDPVPCCWMNYDRAFVTKYVPGGSALVYSRYLGDDHGDSKGNGIAVDSLGNAYITGETDTANFPLANPRQPDIAGETDAFVTKLEPSGNLVYSTYLGGSGSDSGAAIALDRWENAYVTGSTSSSDFPTAYPFQSALAGSVHEGSIYKDAFVTKFNHSGSALVYSTYLGGTGLELGTAIAVDSKGNAYVTGETRSRNFPTANPLQPAGDSSYGDVFVTTFNRSGSSLVFSTYHGAGGINSWDSGRGIALDDIGNAYVTGFTDSHAFPTAHAFQPTAGGQRDAFVLKIGGVVQVENLQFEARPFTVFPGGTITASWAYLFPSASGDWIGLYDTSGAADNAYISRSFTNGLGTGTLAIVIPAGTQFGATYELRLFRNNSSTRVATSNCFTVQPPTLWASAPVVPAGGQFTVSWSYLLSPSTHDWIGLYASSLASNSAYLAYQFTNGQSSGYAVFTVPAATPAGTTYELRLFANGSYNRLATTDSFTVTVPTLSVNPSAVRPGAILTVTWANVVSPSATDWIGLYSSSAASDAAYLKYQYTGGQSNGASGFIIPAYTPVGATYELRLFRNNGYTRLATSNSFRVEAASLRVSPTTVLPGMLVIATWAYIPNPTARDWIGLYASSGAADSPALSWIYTTGQSSGSYPFQIPSGTPPGTTYELRLFSNNGYSRLATSNSFRVQAIP